MDGKLDLLFTSVSISREEFERLSGVAVGVIAAAIQRKSSVSKFGWSIIQRRN